MTTTLDRLTAALKADLHNADLIDIRADALEEAGLPTEAQKERAESRAVRAARAFSRLLRDEIGEQSFTWVCLSARAKLDDGSCASHDYCDANEVMLAALCEVLGVSEEEALADAHQPLWNRAWTLARQNAFWGETDARRLYARRDLFNIGQRIMISVFCWDGWPRAMRRGTHLDLFAEQAVQHCIDGQGGPYIASWCRDNLDQRGCLKG
jgi:hypothetical protein